MEITLNVYPLLIEQKYNAVPDITCSDIAKIGSIGKLPRLLSAVYIGKNWEGDMLFGVIGGVGNYANTIKYLTGGRFISDKEAEKFISDIKNSENFYE